jgi:hypothetical protein
VWGMCSVIVAGVSVCPNCGFPAFALFQGDPGAWVCRVSGRFLSAKLATAADEEPGAFWATIHSSDKPTPDDIRFRFGAAAGEGVRIVSDPEGPLSLRMLNGPVGEAIVKRRCP